MAARLSLSIYNLLFGMAAPGLYFVASLLEMRVRAAGSAADRHYQLSIPNVVHKQRRADQYRLSVVYASTAGLHTSLKKKVRQLASSLTTLDCS